MSEIVVGGPPIPFVPFTLDEFARRAPPGTPPLRDTDFVPEIEKEFKAKGFNVQPHAGTAIGEPRRMTWVEYLKELNTLEAVLNRSGWSLRSQKLSDMTRSGPTLRAPASSSTSQSERTVMRIKVPNRRAVLEAEPLAGGAGQFKTVGKELLVGDPGFLAVGALFRPSAHSASNSWSTSSEMSLRGYLFGGKTELFGLNAESSVPISLAQDDALRFARGSIVFLGGTVNSSYGEAGQNGASAVGEKILDSKEISGSFTVMLGPIPLSITIGMVFDVGPSYRAISSEGVADASVGPKFTSTVFLSGSIGIDGVIGVAARVNYEHLSIAPSLRSKGNVVVDNDARKQCMLWDPSLDLIVSTGKSVLNIYLTVPIPFIGSKTFTIEVHLNDGGSDSIGSIPLLGQPDRVCRELPCGKNASQCPGGCRDLGSDSTSCGFCGNKCGEGKSCVAGQCLSCTNYSSVAADGFQIAFSCQGPIAGMSCISVNEPSSPSWSDNFLCMRGKSGPFQAPPYAWFSGGAPASGFSCTQVAPKGSPRWLQAAGWADNYICAKRDSTGFSATHSFSWSTKRPSPDRQCVRWVEPSQPEFGADNFLCVE